MKGGARSSHKYSDIQSYGHSHGHSKGKQYVFYHIYCNVNTLNIVRDQVTKIIFTGLYKNLEKIHCYLTGVKEVVDIVKAYIETLGKKFVIADIGVGDTTYERFTLTRIQKMIHEKKLHDADKFLYIHSKGVSRSHENGITLECIYLWRNYMEYNLIARHAECVKLLNNCDIVGVAYKDIFIGPHFHGNFWWSNVSYFKKLPAKIGDMYTDPESYIFKANPRFCKMDGSAIANEAFLYTIPKYTKDYIDLPAAHPMKGGGSHKTCDLVIAKFQEKLGWLDEYKERGFHVIHIYDKSDKPIKCPKIENTATKCHVKQIPNVGVCDNTYLYHIVHHYDNLADVTIFAPASGHLDHKREMLDFTINTALSKKDTVVSAYTFDISAKEAMYKFTMAEYPIATKDNHTDDNNWKHELASPRPFGEWYAKNFPGVEIKQASFFGIFAASKAHIHAKPKKFYEDLLKQVNTHKFHEASHFIERSWPAILGAPEECMYYAKIFDERITGDSNGYKYLRR